MGGPVVYGRDRARLAKVLPGLLCWKGRAPLTLSIWMGLLGLVLVVAVTITIQYADRRSKR